MKNTALRSGELQRIHAERQSQIIATVLQECPDPIPKHCLNLLRHAPESFDDLRYGTVAAAAFNLHLNHRPVSILTVQEELARSPAAARTDLTEVFNFLKLQPMPLPAGILEWECEELWHAYAYRQQATVLHDGALSLIEDPDQADSIISHVRRALDDLAISQRNGDGLPDIVDGSALIGIEPELPELLVEGLLHRGSKLSLGGSSKAYKSWGLLNLAFSVATGQPWLGHPTNRARVLYINFEIDSRFMHQRINAIAQARNLKPEPGYLDIWNLRGKSTSHAQIIPQIIARSKDSNYGLNILDPSYKLMGRGTDENSPGDVGAMLDSFENVASETGSAVAYGAHFAKGNAAAKEAIDRVSGSGAFARDPDSILTFTKHEANDCFTVEATLRNLPKMTSFVVKWQYPVFVIQANLDPEKLKQPAGRKSLHSTDDLLDTLGTQSLTTSEWQKTAQNIAGIKESSFYRLKRELSQSDSVIQSRINGCWQRVSKR